VAALRKLDEPRLRDALRETVDLRHRSIFVVFALDREHGQRMRSISRSMFHVRNAGSSQMSFQPKNAESGSS
jgi:hypothetical protein